MTTQEFSTMVQKYQALVYTVCHQLVPDVQEAQDLTQETFLAAWRAIDRCPPGFEKQWLARIAANKAKDYLRSAWKRRVNLMEQLPEVPAPETMPRDEAEELYQAVQALKPKYREVILLHYYHGLRVGEIAAILRAPQSTVSIRLRRARQMLNRMLGGSDQSEDYPREDP